jgi:hypothetical protein
MTKIWMLSLALLLSAAWIQAQQYPEKGSSQSSSTKSNSAATIQGCLQRSEGNFMLTDAAGTTYQIEGDTSKLTEHIGHEVQITGTKSTSSSASASGSPESGSKSSASQQQTIQVQDVKHISATCKSAGK